MKKKFYVTTPIYYVNGAPHLGSLYSTVIADVIARWYKMSGAKTFMLTGTDEHGQKIAAAAAAIDKEPAVFVDQFIPEFKKIWELYGIQYNKFIRTTDVSHKHAVQEWIKQAQKNGAIYKGYYTGFYCTPCETFVTEKEFEHQNEVTCPSCRRLTQKTEEECYFFRLSDYQDRLLQFYNDNPDFITPAERLHEVTAFVKSGLKDLSISRTSIKWGIPFPGDDRHVCYVWADALNNYISAVGYADNKRIDEFNFWWPADMHVLGKDIVRFHAVYWPAFLMAVDIMPPKRLLVHGWIKVGEQKMSKSLGNVINPEHLQKTFGADEVRYYLIRHMAITQDASFSIEDLEQRIDADLVGDLGNLVQRVLSLALANKCATIESPCVWGNDELDLRHKFLLIVEEIELAMKNFLFHQAYAATWKMIELANRYFQVQQPWKVKDDQKRFIEIIAAVTHLIHGIAILVWPVMPSKMELVLQAIGTPLQSLSDHYHLDYHQQIKNSWNKRFQLTPLTVHLFERQKKDEPMLKKNDGEQDNVEGIVSVSFEEFQKVIMVVGTIIAVDIFQKSEKLYRLTVDCGKYGKRNICSGIRKYFSIDDLLGQQATFVINLPPRPLMGTVSEGMLLCALGEDGKMSFIRPSKDALPGTRIS